MQRILAEQTYDAPPERVFAHLAEHEHVQDIFGARVQRLRDGSDGQRNGVGSARRMSLAGLLPFEETVTEFEPPRRLAYRITKGTPLDHHRGEITVTPTPAGGSAVRWEIEVGAKAPGLERVVALALGTLLRRGLRKQRP